MPTDDLLDTRAVCKFFGGTKPLDPATLYRGIIAGRYPKPFRISPRRNRWHLEECKEALKVLSAKRKERAQ